MPVLGKLRFPLIRPYLECASEDCDLSVVSCALRGALVLGEAAPVLGKALQRVEVQPLLHRHELARRGLQRAMIKRSVNKGHWRMVDLLIGQYSKY